MSSEEVSQQPGSSSGGPVSPEEMYTEVWRLPMTKIADHPRVSSSFLARVCARMNVPRPPRGHWVKLVNGMPSPQPPLPEAGPGDLQVWRRGDALGAVSRPVPEAPAPRKIEPEQLRISRSRQHPIVVGRMRSLSRGASSTRGSSSPGGSVW